MFVFCFELIYINFIYEIFLSKIQQLTLSKAGTGCSLNIVFFPKI